MIQNFQDPELPMRDAKSFFAALSMDEISIFLVTEGKDNDPYVYSKLLENNLEGNIRYEVIRIEKIDLTGLGINKGSSGKQPIKTLYHHLKRLHQLKGRLGVDKYYSILAMDKDLDDIKQTIIEDEHVLYTPSYDIEGLLVKKSDLLEIVCAAGCIDKPTADREITLKTQQEIMQNWSHWAALCFANDILHIGHSVGFTPSRINTPYHNSTNLIEWENYKKSILELAISKGISESILDSAISDGLRLAKSSNAYSIFKGKWFINIIASDIRDNFSSLGYDISMIDSKIKASLRSQTNYKILAWEEFILTLRKAEEFIKI